MTYYKQLCEGKPCIVEVLERGTKFVTYRWVLIYGDVIPEDESTPYKCPVNMFNDSFRRLTKLEQALR